MRKIQLVGGAKWGEALDSQGRSLAFFMQEVVNVSQIERLTDHECFRYAVYCLTEDLRLEWSAYSARLHRQRALADRDLLIALNDWLTTNYSHTNDADVIEIHRDNLTQGQRPIRELIQA
jgi:hypothetical protein